MHWPRLMRACEICHRKRWLWQLHRTPARYFVAGMMVQAYERAVVCSEECADIVRRWSTRTTWGTR